MERRRGTTPIGSTRNRMPEETMQEKERIDKATYEVEIFYAITDSISIKTMTEGTAHGMLAAPPTDVSTDTI